MPLLVFTYHLPGNMHIVASSVNAWAVRYQCACVLRKSGKHTRVFYKLPSPVHSVFEMLFRYSLPFPHVYVYRMSHSMKNIHVALQYFVKLRWHWCMMLCVHLSSFIITCLVFFLVLVQAVQAMVQQAMQYIDQTPDLDTKIELIKTLNSVSAGKVSAFSFW